jgi:hypothetical protein
MYGLPATYLRKLRSRRAGPVFSRIGRRLVRYKTADIESWLVVNSEEVRPKRAS